MANKKTSGSGRKFLVPETNMAKSDADNECDICN